jgi:hypothetical protein
VRNITGPVSAGLHRVAWDLRYPASNPVSLDPPPADPAPWDQPPVGPLAMPGTYSVSMATRVDGQVRPAEGPINFAAVPLGTATLGSEDRASLVAFQRDVASLQRAVSGASRALGEAETRLAHLKKGVMDTPSEGQEAALRDMDVQVRALESRLADLKVELRGDRTISSRGESTPPSMMGRISKIVSNAWNATSAPTLTHRDNYTIAATAFSDWLPRLRTLVEQDLVALEDELEAAGGPWTPGRLPRWEGTGSGR